MTEQQNTTTKATTTEANAVHHQTKRGADLALAKKAISPDSHRAVLAGEFSLEEARFLGREGSPFRPAPKTLSKNDRSRDCLCGCGGTSKTGRFVPGHDQRLVTYAKEYVRGGRELNPEQMEYVESSGKLERAQRQVSEEDRRKADKQAKKVKK